MGPVRHFILLALLLLGACSLRGAIDATMPQADRAFALEVVSRLRSGDGNWLRERFAPELWTLTREQVATAPDMFHDEARTTDIIGFEISTDMTDGRTQRRKAFTLVTHGGGRWTVTQFSTYSTGGPDRIVRWSVMPYDSIPPELATLDAVDRALPWVWTVLAALALGGGSLIFWLVRRSRRKHDPWAGRHGGRP